MRAALIAALTFALPCAAQDFIRNKTDDGLPLFWKSRCFHYRISAAGSPTTPARTEDAAIEAAFATWQREADACGNGFRYLRDADLPVSHTRIGRSPENLLLWRTANCRDVVPADDPCRADPDTAHLLCGNAYQCFFDEDDKVDQTIALTSTWYLTKTGEIVDADIEFNSTQHAGATWGDSLPFFFTANDGPVCDSLADATSDCTAYDIQNTLTHELGHAMGFAHVLDPKSTMFEAASFGETSKRVIDRGTALGFCTVYPPADEICEETASKQQPLDGPPVAYGGCAAAPSALALPLLAALAVMRRRGLKSLTPR